MPRLLQLRYEGRVGISTGFACLLIYVFSHWVPEVILVWVCDDTIRYLALGVLAFLTWTTCMLGAWNIVSHEQYQSKILNNLLHERRSNLPRAELRALEICKFLFIGLIIAVGFYLWKSSECFVSRLWLLGKHTERGLIMARDGGLEKVSP